MASEGLLAAFMLDLAALVAGSLGPLGEPPSIHQSRAARRGRGFITVEAGSKGIAAQAVIRMVVDEQRARLRMWREEGRSFFIIHESR